MLPARPPAYLTPSPLSATGTCLQRSFKWILADRGEGTAVEGQSGTGGECEEEEEEEKKKHKKKKVDG